jgi:predicted aldo/keto reductase-like oxidoreductase
MRFTLQGSETSQIDFARAIKMLNFAIDNGANYLDTAYGYHGGQSEIFVGRFIRKGIWMKN